MSDYSKNYTSGVNSSLSEYYPYKFSPDPGEYPLSGMTTDCSNSGMNIKNSEVTLLKQNELNGFSTEGKMNQLWADNMNDKAGHNLKTKHVSVVYNKCSNNASFNPAEFNQDKIDSMKSKVVVSQKTRMTIFIIVFFAIVTLSIIVLCKTNKKQDATITNPVFKQSKNIVMKPMSLYGFDDDKEDKTMKEDSHVKETTTELPKPSDAPSSQGKIESSDDFKILENQPNITTIIIKKLVDAGNPLEMLQDFKFKNAENIKHIKVTGSVREDWLSYVLNTFEKVENLTIDVDQLCIGAAVRNRDSIKALRLESIKSLRLVNSHLCTVVSWIFRWELPNIQRLQIQDADLTMRIFSPLQGFLNRNRKTLNSVSIINSFICSECIISKSNYTDIKEFTILDRQKNLNLYN